MGVGDSLEAAFTLVGPIPAGTWHLVADGVSLAPADLSFDVLWRHGGVDTELVEFAHHFVPLSGASQFDASPFEADGAGVAAPAVRGDQLVLRIRADGDADAGASTVYLPNGDGDKAHGRLPSITLPR